MKRCAQRGAQAVEFALVLPFMIMVIFAVLDFGFLVYNKAVITNASREGARFGVRLSNAWSTAEIGQVACDYAKTSVISVGGDPIDSACDDTAGPMVVTVSPTTLPGFNEPVTVTVSFVTKGFGMGTWWNLGTDPNALGKPITLSATTVMLLE